MEKPTIVSKVKPVAQESAAEISVEEETIAQVSCCEELVELIFFIKMLLLNSNYKNGLKKYTMKFQNVEDVAKSDEIIVGGLQEEVSDLMTQIENIHMEARASRSKITEVTIRQRS